MLVYLVIAAQLLCGCWIGIQPVQSQAQLEIKRHNLPQNRLKLVYGSRSNGSCTDVNNTNVCVGTSVLNDGVLPGLDGVNTSNSTWASEFFTLDGTRGSIRLSFEVNSTNHGRMKLAVFNCPEMGINLPPFSIYFDYSFRPDRNDSVLGNFIMKSQLMVTSCDHLLVFCVKYNTTQPPTRFINLFIPEDGSAKYVFLGEVTFLDGGNEPCYLTPRSAIQVTDSRPTDSLSTSDSATAAACSDSDLCDSCMAAALTTGVISVVTTALLVAGISVAVHITVYQCVCKPRLIRAGRKLEPGGGDTTVYDVVNERVGRTLEMKENEAYGVAAKSRGTNHNDTENIM